MKRYVIYHFAPSFEVYYSCGRASGLYFSQNKEIAQWFDSHCADMQIEFLNNAYPKTGFFKEQLEI